MANVIKNTDRLNETINNLESLLTMLKAAASGDTTLAKISNELNIRPQELNTELNKSFSLYFKSRLRYLSDDDVHSLISLTEHASDKLLKQIFNLDESTKVVFPEYDMEKFWEIVKRVLPFRQYDIVVSKLGYLREPMSYEAIGKTCGLTRARIMQLYNDAVYRLRDESVLTEIFFNDFLDERNKLEDKLNALHEDYSKALVEYDKLVTYLSDLEDVEELNNYIEKHYPDLSRANLEKGVESFNISIDTLNLSTRTYNGLTLAGYNTVLDICNASAADLINVKNLGKTSLLELINVMDEQYSDLPKWNNLRDSILPLI